MVVATQMIKDLLANGVHFGHQTNKWNPRMEKYIFGEKSGIYIIDLKKTEEALGKAMDFVEQLTSQGKKVLFVGTKKQAKKIIKEQAGQCGMFFVDERWLGGCLTNFATIRKSVERLNHIQEIKTGEVYASYAKKEKARIDKEENKLLKNLGGIREMDKLPDCVIVVDAEIEDIAIKEARKIHIPVVALIDTNCDPNMVDFPIPGNDDAIRSIEYIVSKLAEAAEKGGKTFNSGKAVKDLRSKPEEVPVQVKAGTKPEEKKEELVAEAKPEAEEKPAEAPEVKPVVEEKPATQEKTEQEEPARETPEETGSGDISLDK